MALGIGLSTIAELDQFKIYGATLSADLAQRITDIRYSQKVNQVSEITVTFIDSAFLLQKQLMFRINAPVDYRGRHFYVASVETDAAGKNTEAITLRCHPLYIKKLKALVGVFNMSNASASDFVAHEAAAVGMRSLCQPCEKRPMVARDVQEEGYNPKYDEQPSSWTTFRRLAREEGYYMFEAVGVLMFGKPTWFTNHPLISEFPVTWRQHPVTDCIAPPRCSISANEIATPTSVSANIINSRGFLAVPGYKLVLGGVPTFDGKYLLTGIDYSLIKYDQATVTAETPQDPEEPPPPGSGGGGGGQGGTGSALAMVNYALAQAGDAYVYGAEASPDDPDPDAFDCSELVEWTVARAGGLIPDGSSSQYAHCVNHGTIIPLATAINTRGALLWRQGHIAISLGDGRTIEAAGRSYGVTSLSAHGRFTHGMLVPGLTY